MLVQAYEAFEKNDVAPVRNLSELDKKLDHWNKESFKVLSEFLNKNPAESLQALELFSMIRKLERVGDHNQNIAEEIVFYLDARVIKHKKLQKKTKPE
jgi:phosphate transport system protein